MTPLMSNMRSRGLRWYDVDNGVDGCIVSAQVEKIVKKRVTKAGVTEYFVKWKGWPASDNTWYRLRCLCVTPAQSGIACAGSV